LKVRSMADDSFWGDFTVEKPDLETAAVRKLVELKKETTERAAKNSARHGKHSEHVQKLDDGCQGTLVEARDVPAAGQKTAEDLQAEDNAFQKSGLSEQAYDVYKILENFSADPDGDTKEGERDASASTSKSTSSSSGESGDPTLGKLGEAAAAIDQLYRTHP